MLITTRFYLSDKLGNKADIPTTFNYLDYIINPDFDYTVYTIDNLDSSMKSNTMAINKAFDLFYQTVTKDLNTQQKDLIKDNFMESLQVYFKDSTDFRAINKYLHSSK
jgi:hypothetical protein